MSEINSKLKIFSVFHKPFLVPTATYIQPIHAGKAIAKIDLNFMGDDEGDNISNQNKTLSELTVLYAIWKNKLYAPHTYWGLCHYRRYFTLPLWFWQFEKKENAYKIAPTEKNLQKIFSAKFEQKLNSLLQPNTIIISKPWPLTTNKGKTITIKENYCIEHTKEGWDIMEQVVKELYPAYTKSFDEASLLTKLSIGNMMIAQHTIWENYLNWLFTILFEIKKRYTLPSDLYQSRALGFMSERLMNIYLYHHQSTYQIIRMDIATLVQKKEAYVKVAH